MCCAPVTRDTPPTCNHHLRPPRCPNAQNTKCTQASPERSWAARSSFASFPAAYQGQNSPGRCASQQPRSFASLCRLPLRPAEPQQHVVCPLHADPNGRLFMCDSMHETAATPSVSLAAVAMCLCVFSKTIYLDRQRYTVFWPYTICRPNTKTKISRTSLQTHRRSVFFSCM